MEREQDSSRSSIGDVICEFLEVAFNQLLYTRGVYPDGIFRKSKKYGVAVMTNCHPELGQYIRNVLTGLKTLMLTGDVGKVVLQITSYDEKPLERFVFELCMFAMEQIDTSSSYSIEQYLRDLLLKINTCDCMLTPLKKECSFLITVETKESTARDMANNEEFQAFPWVRADKIDGNNGESPNIIPLKSCNTELFSIQCFVVEEIQNKSN